MTVQNGIPSTIFRMWDSTKNRDVQMFGGVFPPVSRNPANVNNIIWSGTYMVDPDTYGSFGTWGFILHIGSNHDYGGWHVQIGITSDHLRVRGNFDADGTQAGFQDNWSAWTTL